MEIQRWLEKSKISGRSGIQTIVMETKLLSSYLKISSFVFGIFISSVHVFGSSQKTWAGVCRPLSRTFALFMIKMCNFPAPFMIVVTGTVALNTICEGLFVDGLILMRKIN